ECGGTGRRLCQRVACTTPANPRPNCAGPPGKISGTDRAAARNACASLRGGWVGCTSQGGLESRGSAGAGERGLRRGNQPFRQGIGAGSKSSTVGSGDTQIGRA